MEKDKKFLIYLAAFLVRAKKATYAQGDHAQKIHEADGSISLIYEEVDWKYHDNYFGGEPFGGREVVFYKDKPVFFMSYYGKVFDHISDFEPIYAFLQKALSKVTEEYPFRGPCQTYDETIFEINDVHSFFAEGDYDYRNIIDGDIRSFSGSEMITEKGISVYEARYSGGLINLR